jgi:hypothetical protein
MIANMEQSPDCKGHWIRVDARASGEFVVTNGRNQVSRTYRGR